MAEARGTAMIRPWRVGVLTDTTSKEGVREAIAKLSSVWGGQFMPIFDIGAPIEELEQQGRQYDVDSLDADAVDGPLGVLLRKPGWIWSGRGPWGPFGEEEGFRKGLLPVRSFIDTSTTLVQPTWDREDQDDLLYAANWGLPDHLGLSLASNGYDNELRSAPYLEVLSSREPNRSTVGVLSATILHIRANPRGYLDGFTGIYVVRPDHPEDVVEFWNMRVYGTKIIGVSAMGTEELLKLLISSGLPFVTDRGMNAGSEVQQDLCVWGFDDASHEISEAIQMVAARNGMKVRPYDRESWTRFEFQGLQTPFTRSIRADFRPGAHWFDIALPTLPINDEPDIIARGIIAAEINLHSVFGQDPRLTGSIPPYRRHSSLLKHALSMEGIDHARVTDSGVALGVSAERDHARFPFVYNQDVMRLLFDDDSVSITQSDIGKFQSRAAEKFGGVFSGVFSQPGNRAAVALAAGRNAGVTLPHLRQTVESQRGNWPDPLYERSLSPKDYAVQQLNRLLYSGLFVPTLRVQCSTCRADSYVSADNLATTMTCEFCGDSFKLALSHSLVQPEWRYRLAAHLRADQVQALLPALATTSFLSQLRHIEEPPLSHMLGLEVSIDRKTVEVDVAVYLPDHDWTVVLGEVKTANYIDANDIANLRFLQDKLSEKGVRCLLLFATLKDEFSSHEIDELRELVEQSKPIQTRNGRVLPNMPLVLTNPDLSQPPGSQSHPWRWDDKNFAGVIGTAIASCERNLGLRNYEFSRSNGQREIQYEWNS